MSYRIDDRAARGSAEPVGVRPFGADTADLVERMRAWRRAAALAGPDVPAGRAADPPVRPVRPD